MHLPVEGKLGKSLAWWLAGLGDKAEASEITYSDAGRDWGQEEKGTTEDKMAGYHHQLNGHGFAQALGDGVGVSLQAPPGSQASSRGEAKARLPRGVRPRLEGKPRTPLSSRVATRVSWSPLSGLKLISFRLVWLDLLAVQGTLQHHSSKASILLCSAFYIV